MTKHNKAKSQAIDVETEEEERYMARAFREMGPVSLDLLKVMSLSLVPCHFIIRFFSSAFTSGPVYQPQPTFFLVSFITVPVSTDFAHPFAGSPVLYHFSEKD